MSTLSRFSNPRSHRWSCAAVFLLIAMWGFSWQAAAPAAAATGQITATWTDTNNDFDGFKIQRKTGTAGTYAQIAILEPTVMSYLDAGLATGSTYCYQVAAYNAAGDSPYTPEVCATLPAPVLYTLSTPGRNYGDVLSHHAARGSAQACCSNRSRSAYRSYRVNRHSNGRAIAS